MKATSLIRILLVDDHYVVRMGLAAVLKFERGFEVVAVAEDGQQAVALFRQHQPDITLMDVRMPVCDGIQATAAIRAEFPEARIIMLTTYDAEEDVYGALQAGARGYLLKKAPQPDLVAAIRLVHQGGHCIPEAVGPRRVAVLDLLAKGLSKHPPTLSEAPPK